MNKNEADQVINTSPVKDSIPVRKRIEPSGTISPKPKVV